MTTGLLSPVDQHLLSLCVDGTTSVDHDERVTSIDYRVDIDLQFRVVDSGGAFTIVETNRYGTYPAFRSNDVHAIVVELVRSRGRRRIRGCVVEQPPGFAIEQAAGRVVTFSWNDSSWAQSLSDDWSLTQGLRWAWVFASGDEAIARWLSGGVLYPEDVSKKCETPPLFAYQLTVAKWEAWLAERPQIEGGKS